MKALTKILILFSIINIALAICPKQVSAQQAAVSLQFFYDNLSPYGQWVNDPDYGYAWIPDVGPDFVPYSTEGHWVFTEYGWTWVSYYDWGWAPFHYGRWDYNDNYGWFWVPDYEWGPSWVVWRRSEGYYGWAPMRPGISIDVAYGRDYYVPNDRWIFVRDRDIWRSHIDRYYVGRSYNVTIINNTTVINRTYEDHTRHVTYVYGPDREEVQRVTGRNVRSVAVYENDRPGERLRSSRLQIYRPEVQRNYGQEHKPAPTRVVGSKDYRRPSNRNSTNAQKDDVYSPNNNSRRNPNPNDNRETQTRTIDHPANNNTQQHNANPSENTRTEQQTRTVNQSTNNNVEQPTQQRTVNQPANNNTQQQTQQRNANPSDNNRGDRQTHTVNQPANNNVEQPTQQRNTNSPDNSRPDRQPRTVNQPANNNTQQQTQQRNANPSDNKQTRTVNQPANNNNVQQSSQQKNTNQSNTNQTNKNKREQRKVQTVKPAEKDKNKDKDQTTNQDRR